MVQKHIRRAKLHCKHRALKSGYGESRYRILPWLNICGLWLEEAGFNIGDGVEIKVEHNTLTIKNCLNDGDSHH
ncbi:MAG: SymE family type I addiction module toxin [Sediminibacterium sp.]|nr:SymE family type I addiction module toxin [Sediminibacterium sp.]